MNKETKEIFIGGFVIGLCVGTLIMLGIMIHTNNQNLLNRGLAHYECNPSTGQTSLIVSNFAGDAHTSTISDFGKVVTWRTNK